MKRYLVFSLFVLLFASCSKPVDVSIFNNSEVDRENETVELCLCQLKEFDPEKIIVSNSDGEVIPSQILTKGTGSPQSLIFQVSLKAGKQVVYTLRESVHETLPSKTKVIPFDTPEKGVAWENERIAFQLLGKAAHAGKSGNGIGVWFKSSDKWILETLLANKVRGTATADAIPYVQPYLGAGGLTLFKNDTLLPNAGFDRLQLLDDGPIRTSFSLTYNSVRYGDKTLTEECVVQLDAGSNLNEVHVRFAGDTSLVKVAAGIYLNDSTQWVSVDNQHSTLGSGSVTAIKNVAAVDSINPSRDYYGMVFTKEWQKTQKKCNHIYALYTLKIGAEFVYYSGAAKGKRFYKKSGDWSNYLKSKRLALMQPLKIKLLK
jgi:hypothetical protein